MNGPEESLNSRHEFSPPSYGYERVVSKETDPNLLNNESKRALKELRGDEMRGLIERVSPMLELGVFANRHPLFVNTRMEGNTVRWELNRKAKPWVYRYTDQGTGKAKSDVPGAKSYFEAEGMTQGDSGLYGLIAAAVGDSESRGKLYVLLAGSMCRHVGTGMLFPLLEGIDNVFLQGEISPATIINFVHNRTGFFSRLGFIGIKPNRSNIVGRQDNALAWKEQSRTLEEKLLSSVPLSMEDIKRIEMISHLFRPEIVIRLMGLMNYSPTKAVTRDSFIRFIQDYDEYNRRVPKLIEELKELKERHKSAGVFERYRIEGKIIKLNNRIYEERVLAGAVIPPHIYSLLAPQTSKK